MSRNILLLAIALLLVPRVSLAEEHIGTLTLDGLSFLSFEHIENLSIPAGSTIRFRFESDSGEGSVSFTIQPSDVSITNLALPGGRGELAYSLARPAQGAVSKKADGFEVNFTAAVSAQRLPRSDAAGGTPHVLAFTTEHTQSASLKTGNTFSIDGVRVVPAARYVQLVGAVTNPSDATPHPGRAVVSVLSGTFDWLPELE